MRKIGAIPDSVLTYEARSNLRNAGYLYCADLLLLDDKLLKQLTDLDASGCDQLRAAASFALIPSADEALIERLMALNLSGGVLGLIEAKPKTLSDRLNQDQTGSAVRLTPDDILAMQDGAAEALLKGAVRELSAKGWATQFAALVQPTDLQVRRFQELLRICGSFPRARPLLGQIEQFFSGFGGLTGGGAAIRQTLEEVRRRPDEVEKRRAELKREAGMLLGAWPPGPGIESLVGMTAEACQALKAQGLETVYQFRLAHMGRLAEQTKLSPDLLERWRRQADLQIRPGVSPSLAYTVVDYDQVRKPKRSWYEKLLGEPYQYDSSDPELGRLLKHGAGLHKAGTVPEDPFPVVLAGYSQQTLDYVHIYQTDQNMRRVLLDPIGGDHDARLRADDLTATLEQVWMGGNDPKGGSLFPFTPLFFNRTRPWGSNLDQTPDQRVQMAVAQKAELLLVIDGTLDSGGIVMPGRLGQQVRFDVVNGLEQSQQFRDRYKPGEARKRGRLPIWFIQVDLQELWTYVTEDFQLVQFVSPDEPFLRGLNRNLPPDQQPSWLKNTVVYLPVALCHTIRRVQELQNAVNQQGLGVRPLAVYSGYRSPENPWSTKNPESPHQWGSAVDITEIGGQPLNWHGHKALSPNYLYSLAHGQPLDLSSPNFSGQFQVEGAPSLDRWHAFESEWYQKKYGLGTHAHLDHGRFTEEQEQEVIRRYAAGQESQPVGIYIAADPELSGAERFATPIHNHLKGTLNEPSANPHFPPPTGYFPVTTPRPSEEPILRAAVKQGIPAVLVRFGPVGDVAVKNIEFRQKLAKALLGAILEGLDKGLGTVVGTVEEIDFQGRRHKSKGAHVRLLPVGGLGSTEIDPADLYRKIYTSTLTDDEGNYSLYAVVPKQRVGDSQPDIQIAVSKGSFYSMKTVEYGVKYGENRVPTITIQQQIGPLRRFPCFVATAVFQDPWAAPVRTLRAFREEVLRRYRLGRAFIRWYEQAGPRLSGWLERHPGARPGLRFLLSVVSRGAGLLVRTHQGTR